MRYPDPDDSSDSPDSPDSLDLNVPAAPHSVADMLERRLRDAGLVDANDKPITTLHGLRATGATLAAEAGVNPLVIQHQLGHAELRTTQESYLGAPDPDLLAPYAAVFGCSPATAP